jgi:hypothetical protein
MLFLPGISRSLLRSFKKKEGRKKHLKFKIICQVYYSNNISNSKKELGTESKRKCKSTQMEGQALLNRHSDEDCSGCKVEQARELGTDRSFQNVSLIWIIIISACKYWTI